MLKVDKHACIDCRYKTLEELGWNRVFDFSEHKALVGTKGPSVG